MSFRMIDYLGDIGFVDDCNSGYSRLICKLDGHVFYAIEASDIYSRPEIRIMANISTKSASWVFDDHLPVETESREQAMAWVSWVFRDWLRYIVAACPAWIQQGEKYWHMLPWKREQHDYESRPQCVADRNWVRLALKNLAYRLENNACDTSVRFAFNGEILIIRIDNDVIAFPAKGQKWTQEYHISASNLRTSLPKRLMYQEATFHVWKGYFKIDGHSYECINLDEAVAAQEEKIPQGTSLH